MVAPDLRARVEFPHLNPSEAKFHLLQLSKSGLVPVALIKLITTVTPVFPTRSYPHRV